MKQKKVAFKCLLKDYKELRRLFSYILVNSWILHLISDRENNLDTFIKNKKFDLELLSI